MKIQNKRARVWIVLGLLGLIEKFLYPLFTIVFGFLFGATGQVVGMMLGDVAVIFLLIGWYSENRYRKNNPVV